MRTTQTDRRAGLVCALTALLLVAGVAGARAQNPPPPVSRPSASRPRPPPSRASRSTGSRCSTSATTSSRSTRTGPTPCASPGCRRSRTSSARTTTRSPASARAGFGVRSSTPTALGELKTTFEFELFGTGVDEGQTTFRLRHAYGELGAFGAGQYLDALHGHRRVPQLARVLGPHGHGVLPQRAGALDAGERRRAQRDARARAARRQRRRRRLRGPHRAAEHQGPLPAARLLRVLQVRAEVGLRPGRRHAPDDQVGRRARRPVRPLRRRHRLGHQPQLQPQRRPTATSSGCSSSSARASRTT